jgi:hypothetical protein
MSLKMAEWAPLFSTPAVVALGGSLDRFFESPLALLVRGHSRCALTVSRRPMPDFPDPPLVERGTME